MPSSIYTIGDRCRLGYPVDLDIGGSRYAIGTYPTVAEAVAAIDADVANWAPTDYIVTRSDEAA